MAVSAGASGHGLERCGGLRRLAALFAAALLIASAMLCVAGFTVVPESSAATAGRSVLIVAPHPDDDILYGPVSLQTLWPMATPSRSST